MNRLQTINKNLLVIAFVIANLLWVKSFIDIYNYKDVNPNFRFPEFFIVLFFVGSIITILLSLFCLKNMRKVSTTEPISGTWAFLFWLAIPVSLICVSPVCYRDSIFIAAYPASAVIRFGLLIIPIIAGILYNNKKKEVAIFILLCLSFLLLIPNDKCRNAFNYWWIAKVGASPLTYLPTMFVMLFAITGLYGKNKYLISLILCGLCAGALFLAIGHRIKLLW